MESWKSENVRVLHGTKAHEMDVPDLANPELAELISRNTHFMEELVRPVPNIGGGSVSAHTGGIAVLLMLKVCRIEQLHFKANASTMNDWSELAIKCEHCAATFLNLVSQDCAAYAEWAAARKNPEDDVTYRKALHAVIDVPFQIISAALMGLSLAKKVSIACRSHLVPDILVSVEMLRSTLLGGQAIADANIKEAGRGKISPDLVDGIFRAVESGKSVYLELMQRCSGKNVVHEC